MAQIRRAWMEVEIERAGADVRVVARGSRDERPAPHVLGPALPLTAFAAAVRAAAARKRPLGEHLAEAKRLHGALFREGVTLLTSRLAEAAAGAQVIVRLLIRDAELQGVPWEALCEPASSMGFLGTSPDLLPVRGVTSAEPWQPGALRGALRVLVIAPQGGHGVRLSRGALADSIDAGHIEWLEPIEGPAADLRWLFQRLRDEPSPHVLHFLGHGGVQGGVPALRFADTDDGEESWLPVELFAQQLKASFRGQLRLVVLEACDGARPSAFASAAEIFARAGADAVVAHLWPVQADAARLCSEQLYRALAGPAPHRGDVAASLNEARRAVLGAFGGSAEAFSPVLYLRGTTGVLFDFADARGAGAESTGDSGTSTDDSAARPGANMPPPAAGANMPPAAPAPSSEADKLPASAYGPRGAGLEPLPPSGTVRGMRHSLTLDIGSTTGHIPDRYEEMPALMIAWARFEPERVGEIALFEPGAGARVLGRGEPESGAGGERVSFHRQRPGALMPTPPLASPGISREQLRIRLESGNLRVERIGKCPVEIGGEIVESRVLVPGDLLLLRGQMMLLYTHRPWRMPALANANVEDAPEFGAPDRFGLVGESPASWRLRDRLAWAAAAEENAFIGGPSGVGKTMCARAVHGLSRRAAGPFVAQSLSAVQESLRAAELFGSAAPQPITAGLDRSGLLAAARGGTLFLDEIDLLARDLQARLLRVLDEGAGRSSVRLIASTAGEAWEMHHGLLARLVVHLDVPGLAERREDIPLLARHLLRRASAKSPEATARFLRGAGAETAEPRVKASFVARLLAHRYTAHVRELNALLWRAMSGSPGDTIEWSEGAAARPPSPITAPVELAEGRGPDKPRSQG